VKFVSTAEFGTSLDPPVSEQRVRVWCKEGRLPGAQKVGRDHIIPADCPDPRKWKPKTKGPNDER
jgi:hypothetical protein